MKKLRVLCMFLLILTLVLSTVSAGFADSRTFEGNIEYNNAGDGFKSDFDSASLSSVWNQMEPGDEVTITINYKNTSKVTTRWYMKNEVLDTLEGAGSKAQNGGYTYILNNYAPSGDIELFSNDIGGENAPSGLEGLKQATTALKDHVFIAELEPGKAGRIVLNVKFDGETEVNDYMDTNGKIRFNFAVEEKGSTEQVVSVDKHVTKKITVKTGDTTMSIWPLIAVNAVAVILLLIVFLGWKKRKGGEKA